VHVFQVPTGTGQPVLLGKTEQIKDNHECFTYEPASLIDSPVFVTPIQMDYFFEEEQRLRFVVVDVDNPKGALNEQDFLGVLDTTLGNISISDVMR
jgi:hypothetical protein